MNGTLQTMNGRRYRGVIDIDDVGATLTGVPIPTHSEVIGLAERTITVPWGNISHIDWDAATCES